MPWYVVASTWTASVSASAACAQAINFSSTLLRVDLESSLFSPKI